MKQVAMIEKDYCKESNIHRLAVLSYDQVARLNEVMNEVVSIQGRGNFPTIEVPLKDLVAVVRSKLEEDGCGSNTVLKVNDIRLNGGAASYVLDVEESTQVYNDLDLIFAVELSSGRHFDRVKTAVLNSLLDLLPEGVSRKRMSTCSLKEIPKMVKEQVPASNTNSIETSNDLILRMRGLPWSATVDDIIKFLENAKIKNGQAGIHITLSREGRPSGEAFVELETAADVDEAMKKDKQHMGHRYIEIFKASRTDMDWKLEKSDTNVENVVDECCIRLRGLPYGCTKNDITDFFAGLTIVPNGISFVSDQTGRNTGEAYVQFVNKDMVESALKKHLDRIGHRYIEIFRSSLAEITGQSTSKIRPLMSEIVARPTPYDRGERFGGMNRFGRGPPGPPPRNQEFFEDNYNYDNTWNMRKSGPGPMREPPTLPHLGRRLSPPPAVARLRNLMYGAGQGGAVDDDWVNQNERHIVRMRGLPYRAMEQDIFQFFAPLVPTNVNIILERSGRPSGEAEVEFQTYEDAEAALAKDKQNMHNRYIELFLGPKSANKQSNLSGKNMIGGFTKKNVPDSPFPRRSMPGGNAMNNSSYLGGHRRLETVHFEGRL